MPLTPLEAIAKSGRAGQAFILDPDDVIAHANITNSIDGFIDNWNGQPFAVKSIAASVRVINVIVRQYGEASWTVTAQPIDGRFAKAQDLLSAGGAPEWIITLIPRW